LEERFDRRIEEVEENLSRRIERLGDAFVSYQGFFVKYLVSEEVPKPSATDVVVTDDRNQMKRVSYHIKRVRGQVLIFVEIRR